MMKIESVSLDTIHKGFEQPYNPPQIHGDSDKATFEREYENAQDAVRACLAGFGTEDDYGEGDFCLNQDFGFSRHIAVELSSPKLMQPKVFEALQNTLAALGERYRTYVDHGLLDKPDFFIFIETDRAVGHCEDAALLAQLES
jgi:hypothetical protein